MGASYIRELYGVASSGGQVPVSVVVAAQFEERHTGRRVTHGGGVASSGRGNKLGIVGGNGTLISRIPPIKIKIILSNSMLTMCSRSRDIVVLLFIVFLTIQVVMIK